MAYHADFTIATGVPVYLCNLPRPLATRLQREHLRLGRWQHTADGRGRAPHVPDRAAACGGERSLMGTPSSRLTRTIVVKAVPEKYS
jgi:hypothetical protein